MKTTRRGLFGLFAAGAVVAANPEMVITAPKESAVPLIAVSPSSAACNFEVLTLADHDAAREIFRKFLSYMRSQGYTES